jgi:hypothetical protein
VGVDKRDDHLRVLIKKIKIKEMILIKKKKDKTDDERRSGVRCALFGSCDLFASLATCELRQDKNESHEEKGGAQAVAGFCTEGCRLIRAVHHCRS